MILNKAELSPFLTLVFGFLDKFAMPCPFLDLFPKLEFCSIFGELLDWPLRLELVLLRVLCAAAAIFVRQFK